MSEGSRSVGTKWMRIHLCKLYFIQTYILHTYINVGRFIYQYISMKQYDGEAERVGGNNMDADTRMRFILHTIYVHTYIMIGRWIYQYISANHKHDRGRSMCVGTTWMWIHVCYSSFIRDIYRHTYINAGRCIY